MKTLKDKFATSYKKVAFVGASSLIFAGQCYAAIPAEATKAMTDLTKDAASMVALAWPLVLATVGVFFIIRLFKRVIRQG